MWKTGIPQYRKRRHFCIYMFKEYPDVLTVEQMAHALHIGKNSAYQLIHDHEIRCKRVGRKIIVPKCCVVDYVLSARYTENTL